MQIKERVISLFAWIRARVMGALQWGRERARGWTPRQWVSWTLLFSLSIGLVWGGLAALLDRPEEPGPTYSKAEEVAPEIGFALFSSPKEDPAPVGPPPPEAPPEPEVLTVITTGPPKIEWPASGQVITDMGWNEVNGVWRYSQGLEIAASLGEAVYAPASGQVAEVGEDLYDGTYLVIDHDGGWMTRLGHLSRVFVTPGQSVTQGQKVAEVGRSGHTNGSQLYFEVKYGKNAVHPTSLMQ